MTVSVRFLAVLPALLVIAAPGLPATPEQDALTVVVRDGQSLRDIAREYFSDPNLWREILRVNELSSAENVRPGMELKVPRNEITLANSALVASLDVIQQATETGARVFSADLLESAVRNRQEALDRRQRSDWPGCRNYALEAKAYAEKAYRLALSQRNAAAQAILKSASGTVQSRKTSDLVWNGVGAGASLEETEKVRTMSDSAAEILFVDESRIRLDANSQAVIQKMRVDRLNHQQKASVSLLEGDVYALLSSAGGGKGVDVKIEGVTTDTRSTDFWVSRQAKHTKFANYDDERIEITSAGETVTLLKNQGTIVEAGRSPSEVRDLLPPPTLIQPEDDHVQLGDDAPIMRWGAVEGAVHYKLAVATDPSFSDVVLKRSQKKGTEHRADQLDDGVYYWRVTAVDALGFPGAKSRLRRFQVMRAVGAPFLALASPAEGAITRTPRITVRGTTVARSRVTLDGSEVDVDAEGIFSVEYSLMEGDNVITLEVTGEAGGSTRLERNVVYMPDRTARVEFHPDLVRVGAGGFATREPSLLLSGTTTPDSRIDVVGTPMSTYSDADGRFQLNLPVSPDAREVSIAVTSPSGYVSEDRFTVERDVRPPELRVPNPPESLIPDESIELRGTVTGAHELRLNGEPVPLAGGAFVVRYPLQPGPNSVRLVALDRVGNEAIWTRTLFRDSDPPSLGAARVSPQKTSGGEVLDITVKASDATEMKRYAAVLVQVGSWKETASLALDPEAGTYRGSIRAPHSVQGAVVLKHVVLEDYLGNKKAYRLR